MNEENLPKPQTTKEKNSKYTAVKIAALVMFVGAEVAGILYATNIISEELLPVLILPAVIGIYLFLGIFIFMRYRRTHKKK